MIEFTGEDFKLWDRTFFAHVSRKVYKKALEGKIKIPTKHNLTQLNEKMMALRRKYARTTNCIMNKSAYVRGYLVVD